MNSRPAPTSVRIAFCLWMAAIATAIIELATRLLTDPRGLTDTITASGFELAVRCSAYLLLAVLATFMLRGSNNDRHLLTLIFGCFGTFSLVSEPIGWIAAGGDVVGFLSGADATLWLMIVSRLFHIVAVLGAVAFGYRSDANAYFRRPA